MIEGTSGSERERARTSGSERERAGASENRKRTTGRDPHLRARPLGEKEYELRVIGPAKFPK
jgi:hypothetical protein